MMHRLWLLLPLQLLLATLAQDASNLRGSAGSLEQVLVFDAGSSGTRIHIFNMYMPAGGLRAVGEAKANPILAAVRATLRGTTYKFQDEWVDIIKGKEEAGLAWVAANYLQGTFAGPSPSPSNTIGVIEMGGGSTQVSFEVDASESQRLIDSDRFVFTTASRRQYFVYAHSYLGYGQDYAQEKLKKLMDAAGTTDPCYPKGHSRKDDPGRVVNGTGDAESCKSKIQSLLLEDQQAPGHYEHELPLRGSLVATENFFYVRSGLGLAQKEAVRPTDAEAQAACSQPWPPALENGCFGLSYQVSLLRSLKASGDMVKVQRKIKGGDIDWAIGAALVHLLDGRAGANGGSEFSLRSGFTVFAVIFASLLLAFFAYFRLRLNSRKCQKRMDPVLFGSKMGALE
eukprot:TRINITY_DN19517_c0_g1_i2.p1 TRINITY_DN19517_c0_g1~~TRINITY_DN19517_c0_g1_i2.p1  ORF type:complete len:398 (+),score=72.42 TRINITY_DN19517_c0_g1_i2:53-1246(+)